MHRRTFLRGLAGASGGLMLGSLTACGTSDPPSSRDPTGDQIEFRHGVASGDPLPDRVMLWTRVTPTVEGSVRGRWRICSDPGLTIEVASGSFETDASRDYTVHVDADGLAPGHWYYYRFEAGVGLSPIGRTRTAPVGPLARLRLAFTSCADYTSGYFNAYRAMAERNDLDLVLHLGDYYYEYGALGLDGRDSEPPGEVLNLDDYRERHALYKRDPDLAELHRQLPMVVVWDDHESANNAWSDGAENHTEGEEGIWAERKAASIQAYFEWMPIRRVDPENPQRIWRSFRFGDLVDLLMLDTRLYGRAEPLILPVDPRRNAPEREMLGPAQNDWLGQELVASQATWKLMGQQVMFGQLRLVTLPDLQLLGASLAQELIAINMDQWDGYTAARDRVFDFIEAAQIDNVVVLTGDIHSSWGIELYRDPGELVPLVSGLVDNLTGNFINLGLGPKPLAVEFVSPSVTSTGFPPGTTALLKPLFKVLDPHIKYFDGDRHGYVLLDIDHQRVQAEWHYVDSIDDPLASSAMAASMQVRAGVGRLEPGAAETGVEPPAERAPSVSARVRTT